MARSNHFQLRSPRFWERKSLASFLLWPLSLLFACLVSLRKTLYELRILKSQKIAVPVIFVGNIRVGGTGKTPMVIALAKELHARGVRIGIISRGYQKNTSNTAPMEVTSLCDTARCGDEPVLMAKNLESQHIPVVVSRHRVAAAKQLLQDHPEVKVLLSDDGLQHLTLARWPAREGGKDIEIVVRDERGEGNGFLIPAGPLREPKARARDLTLELSTSTNDTNGLQELFFEEAPLYKTSASLETCYPLGKPHQSIDLKRLNDLGLNSSDVYAAAGIGYPEKFFKALESAGLSFQSLPLEDHYDYSINPFPEHAKLILITEKDAVKCEADTQYQQDERIWVVPLEVQLPQDLVQRILSILNRPNPNQ